ncbi:MAG TPA: tetratricopeptide repeat protein [Methylomirabilota bacterium]|nr:tetratricopeptide repeat protein [Methylomirabilota bacterium]
MLDTLRRSALFVIMAVMLLAATSPAPVGADGGGGGGGGGGDMSSGPPAKPEDPKYTEAVRAIKAKEYAKAVPLLQDVVSRDASNADAYNWLGYATRKNGNPSEAIPYYQKALAIDPKHRGAHEYVGEAYLMLDDLPKAKDHLRTLDKLCFLPCSEYSDLKKAVEAYEKTGGKTKPTASSH